MVYRHNPYNSCVLAECDRHYTSIVDPYKCSASYSSLGSRYSVSVVLPSFGHSVSPEATSKADTSVSSRTSDGFAADVSAPDTNRTPKSDSVADHYKTRLCATFQAKGYCSYESYCRFAHGEHDLRAYAQNVRAGLTTEEAIRNYQAAHAPVRAKRTLARKSKKVNRKI